MIHSEKIKSKVIHIERSINASVMIIWYWIAVSKIFLENNFYTRISIHRI